MIKIIVVVFALAAAPVWGQSVGNPVDDVTQLANPKNRTVTPDYVGRKPTEHPTPALKAVHSLPVALNLPDGLGEKIATTCFDGLRKSFYDPYSARMDDFKILRTPEGGFAVVVMLNAKNRFGAYVGASPFYCVKTAAGEWKGGKGEP